VPALTSRQRLRRRAATVFWRVVNPLARPLAGFVPWWVVLETTGRHSKRPRRVPLAKGPVEGNTAWLIAVHGDHASFAQNINADPKVRLKLRGRWLIGSASIIPIDEVILRRFNRYARSGPQVLGIEPKLVRVELE
jgi:deazaflavin-dependent oxidoreductase (nitroreductase family)